MRDPRPSRQTFEVAVPRGLSGGAVLELELPAQERNKYRKVIAARGTSSAAALEGEAPAP